MKRRVIIALAAAFVTAVGFGIVVAGSIAPIDTAAAQCTPGRRC
jgi:hypothetical protein